MEPVQALWATDPLLDHPYGEASPYIQPELALVSAHVLYIPPCPTVKSFAASPRWLPYRHQELMLRAPEVASSPGWTSLSPTTSPHWASTPVLTMLVASTELTSVCQCLSCMGRAQTWTQYSRNSLIEYHYLHIYKARNLYCILHQPPSTFKDFKVLLSC